MERLKDYKIIGNLTELKNILHSTARLSTSLDDLLSVLSKKRENYIAVGYGENLSVAYQNATVSDRRCRLVHAFFSHNAGIGIHEFYNFIKRLGNNVFFGYSYDNADNKVKLVLICN